MNTQRITLDSQQALLLLDNVSDALVCTNPAGEIVYLNEPARQFEAVQTALETHASLYLNDISARVVPVNIPLDGLAVFRLQQPNQPDLQASPTGNKCAWQTVLNQPEVLSEVLDNLGLGMVLLNDQGSIGAINTRAQTLLGAPRSAAGDYPITDFLPELGQLLEARSGTGLKAVNIRHKDHHLKGFLLHLNEDKTPVLLTFLDPSVFQEHEIERVGLLRMLIHDLSNPLYIALNFGRLLQDNIITGQEAAQASDIIINNLQRMQDLLSDLSVLEQLGENILESFEIVEITVIAATVITNLEDRAASRGVRLQLNPLPDGNCYIYGNERLVSQALHNLVENAIKYTLPGGWVRLTVRTTGGFHQFVVADSGIGIAPSKHARLFSPFYRVKDPRMQEVNGTGLGLSLVKLVASQHQGSVRMHSVPDKGSIFVFKLPRHKPPDADTVDGETGPAQ